VRPGALHSELAGAPVSGSVQAEQRGEALLFDLALQAGGGAGSKASRLVWPGILRKLDRTDPSFRN
jgi:hypothetical protein